MAYRSELEAALARIDAMAPHRPCPTCARRAARSAWRMRALDLVGSLVLWTVVGVVSAVAVSLLVLAAVFA